MTSSVAASVAIGEVQRAVTGLPAFIAGSSVAALKHAHIDNKAFNDVDVFVATPTSLIAAVERLQLSGFVLTARYARVFARLLKMGITNWHTHSLKLVKFMGPGTDPAHHEEIEVNVIFKRVDGHPTTSLAQVIESFDFGLLHWGWDAQDQVYRDMRRYLFPSNNIVYMVDAPLPMMPIRRDNWRNGFISQYQGLREVGRYARYHEYGYDMSLVRDDLLVGYRQAALYLEDRTDNPEKVTLGAIYQSLADSIEDDDFAALEEAAKQILLLDDLDDIMEALE